MSKTRSSEQQVQLRAQQQRLLKQQKELKFWQEKLIQQNIQLWQEQIRFNIERDRWHRNKYNTDSEEEYGSGENLIPLGEGDRIPVYIMKGQQKRSKSSKKAQDRQETNWLWGYTSHRQWISVHRNPTIPVETIPSTPKATRSVLSPDMISPGWDHF